MSKYPSLQFSLLLPAWMTTVSDEHIDLGETELDWNEWFTDDEDDEVEEPDDTMFKFPFIDWLLVHLLQPDWFAVLLLPNVLLPFKLVAFFSKRALFWAIGNEYIWAALLLLALGLLAPLLLLKLLDRWTWTAEAAAANCWHADDLLYEP